MKFNVFFLSILYSVIANNVALAAALPTGGQFVAGNGEINRYDNNLSVISPNKNNVIKWDSFDIAANNKVLFDTNNYLNLVKGGKPTIIEGEISSMGKVVIVNPNGISIESGANISVNKFGLSTAHISDESIDNFAKTGNLTITGKGMGKVSLLGSISANNLQVDAGQIIIKNTANITNLDGDLLVNNRLNTDPLKQKVTLKSSTSRIDIGGDKGFDIENNYSLKNGDYVDQRGKIAISSSQDFLNIDHKLNGDYWLTNDINLGSINAPIGHGSAFSGTLDGAYNHISYDITSDGNNKTNLGLFEKLDSATISNIMFDKATINLTNSNTNINIGALAGEIARSQLTNVVINNLDVNLNNNTGHLAIGSVAGALTGPTPSSFLNVQGTLGKIDAIASNDTSIGSFLGTAVASAELKGLNVGISDKNYNAIGDNRTSLKIFNDNEKAILDAKNNNSSLFDKSFVTNGNTPLNKGFLKPFFIEDSSLDYDGKVHHYDDILKDKYNWFEIYDKALITGDKGFINAGIHHVDLKSIDNSHYFVNQDGTTSYIGDAKVNINKVNLGNLIIGNATIEQDDSLPNFTIDNQDELNFVNGESLKDLNIKFEVENYDGKEGSYTIKVVESGDNNYTFTQSFGTLKVNKKEIIEAYPIKPAPKPLYPLEPSKPIKPDNSMPWYPLEPSQPIKPDNSMPWYPLEPSQPIKPDNSMPWYPLEPSKPIKPDNSVEWLPITPAKPIKPQGNKVPSFGSHLMHLLTSTDTNCHFCSQGHSLFTKREAGSMEFSRLMLDIRDLSLAQNQPKDSDENLKINQSGNIVVTDNDIPTNDVATL